MPNIKGEIETGAFYPYTSFSDNSALYGQSNNGVRLTGDDRGGELIILFNASRSYQIYKDNCNAVRVKSYGVYIWVRTN